MKISTIILFIGILMSCNNTQQKLSNTTQDLDKVLVQPEKVGFSSAALADLLNRLERDQFNIHHLAINRNGKTILSTSFYPYSGKTTPHDIVSATKSITSILIGIAIDKGFIKNEKERVVKYFQEYDLENMNDFKRNLTIEDLLTMRTGFVSTEEERIRQFVEMRAKKDWTKYILDKEIKSKPGTQFGYYDGASHLLSAIIQKSTGMSAKDFAQEYLFQPMGINEFFWDEDPSGVTMGWGDCFLKPEDFIKIGQLMLNEGNFDSQQLVSKQWVLKSTSAITESDDGTGYGYQWWVSPEIKSVFEARGRGGQRLIIWKDKGLVIVELGGGFPTNEVNEQIVSAMKSDTPLPQDSLNYRKLNIISDDLSRSKEKRIPVSIPTFFNDIAGNRYIFEENTIGFEWFEIHKDSSATCLLNLKIKGEKLKIGRVGLNNKYRFSNISRYNLPTAIKGYWEGTKFYIDYNECSDVDKYQIMIDFKQQNEGVVLWSISESAGLGIMDETIRAIKK
jgi:CubicO group peptidase (beta-lactamase class C family)